MTSVLENLVTRVLTEPVYSGDIDIPPGAAFRHILAKVPKLFEAVFVKEDKEALENVSVAIIRLLFLTNTNFDPQAKFSQSPEYKEALDLYQARLASGKSEESVKEIVAR